MILPVKLNQRSILSKLLPFLPKREDFRIFLEQNKYSSTEISHAINEVYINGTFKTTVEKRHLFADKELINYIPENANILDVGASDGSTSLDLINQLDNSYSNFHITDYNLYISSEKSTFWTKFYDDNSENCILAVNNLFVAYPNENGVLKKMFSKPRSNKVRLPLVIPEVVKLVNEKNNVFLSHYNVFEPWEREKLDVIKVANVLNQVYFSDDLIKTAINNLFDALTENGVLCVIENRNQNTINRASIYRKTENSFELVKNINGELDIENLVLNYKNKKE